MLNYEGEMTNLNRQTQHPMSMDEDEIFGISTSTVSQWDDHVDSVISSAFVSDDNEPDFNYHVSQFAHVLNLQDEMSKYSASIGSCSISNDEKCPLFCDPFTTTTSQLEESLSEILCWMTTSKQWMPSLQHKLLHHLVLKKINSQSFGSYQKN